MTEEVVPDLPRARQTTEMREQTACSYAEGGRPESGKGGGVVEPVASER